MNSSNGMNAQFFGLTDDNLLLSFKADSPDSVTKTPINGLDGVLLGIDVRPADGKIYGLTTANKIYTIDPSAAGSGSFGRTGTLTDSEETALLSNNLYVNLHTGGFAPGELRGQLIADAENDIVQRNLALTEAQQTNPVPDGPATGSFDVVYDDATNRLDITGSFSGLTSSLMPIGGMDSVGNPESAIHIHSGAAGANGPIVRNLMVTGNSFSGSFTLTDAEETLLLSDNLYVNLHTDGFAAGELRGQLNVDLEGDVVASGLTFEEAQQVNDVPDGPATGAIAITYDNSTNELITEGTYSNLSSALLPIGGADSAGNPESPIHIHMGAMGENGPIVRNLSFQDAGTTFVSELDIPFEGGTISGFDFNPAADRLRLVGDNDQNFRINVDTGAVIVDGTLTFVDDDANAGVNPNTTAVAYTNSFDGTTSTEMFNIDTLLNQLIQQVPPNDGTLKTIGDLGVDFDTLGGFDILSDGMGGNMAYAASDGMLYSIDLSTGAATSLGELGDGMASQNLQGLAVQQAEMSLGDDAMFVGLTDGNQMIMFSADGDDMSTVDVTGVEGVLLGIDVRPATGEIYGLDTNNNLYTIALDGTATLASTLDIPFEGGTISGFDFNPAADRLRLVGDNDQNFRINVDTGEVILDGMLAFTGDDANAGVNPNTTAVAYTNSFDGTTSTAMYNIDTLLNQLIQQVPPNDGTLKTIGDLGVDFDTLGGFDILSNGMGGNAAFAVSNDKLYSIDLSSGAATEVRSLNLNGMPNLQGLAVLDGSMNMSSNMNMDMSDDMDMGNMDVSFAVEPGKFFALTDGNMLVSFSADSLDSVTKTAVTGLEGVLLGIDVRPATGEIYGLTTANKLYTIATDGTATFASELDMPFEGGTISGFDFNPAADRLRLVGDNDQNFRINVDTGEVILDGMLAFTDDDANSGVNPNTTAVAYTNSFDGTTSTAMFNIDTLLNQLIQQVPPNDGTLKTIGDLGIDFDTLGGFDIISDGMGGNSAFALSNGMLYSIDLSSGAAMSLGQVGDDPLLNIQGLTVMAAMDDGGMEDMDENQDITDDLTLFGTGASETLSGGAGNDLIYGNGGEDMLSGNGGNDQLYGASMSDRLSGGSGDDILYGNGGEDMLTGGSGDDLIYGGSQADVIMGGSGDDVIYGNGGSDRIDSGTGMDEIWLGGASDAMITLNSGEGFVTIKNFQMGNTQLLFSGAVTYEDSSDGAQIFSGTDLLAVVSWKTASQVQGSVMMG